MPISHVEHLLAELGRPFPDTVKICGHFRAPIMKNSSTRISYKVYDQQALCQAFSSGHQKIFFDARWRDGQLEEGREAGSSESAKAALAAAKRRAANTEVNRPITSQSTIIIKNTNGRPSRELEVICWPDLYTQKGIAKLCLRFYVAKISFE